MTSKRIVSNFFLPCAAICFCWKASAQCVSPAGTGRSAVVANAESNNNLPVVVGRSILLDCSKQVERISLGLGGFAEAVAISPTEILVNGKAAGETSLIVWEQGGRREFFNVTVRSSVVDTVDRISTVRHELEMQLPAQDIKISAENGTVFLSGTAKDLSSSDRAVQIAGVAGKVVNLLNIEVPGAPPQILLKVVFASVDRNKSKQLGINIFSTGLGNTIGGITTGQFTAPTVSAATATTAAAASVSSELNLFAYFPGLGLGATIQALEAQGLVEVLSEPNVLTESGKQGSFLAGGEYPYPVVQGGSGSSAPSVTIMFKEYGIRLNVIPTITPRGTIHLQVAPEVSSLDFANSIQVSGFSVPAIDVRKVKTEIELSEGQSFAIGGLLDNRETQTLQRIPFISNIPVLGKFFQSISKNKTNSELIVIVTPEIVKPIPRGQTLPAPNFPEPFLTPNSSVLMQTPQTDKSNEQPKPSRATMPVEELIRSMKPVTRLRLMAALRLPPGDLHRVERKPGLLPSRTCGCQFL